jgi:hypothetical protein
MYLWGRGGYDRIRGRGRDENSGYGRRRDEKSGRTPTVIPTPTVDPNR